MALAMAVLVLFVVAMKQDHRLDQLTGSGVMSRHGRPFLDEGRPFMKDHRLTKEGYKLYTDPDGTFVFMHPKGTYVHVGTSTSTRLGVTGTVTEITLAGQPFSEGPVPDMMITIENGYSQSVQFRTWENLDIPYFAELVSSFRLIEQAPTSRS